MSVQSVMKHALRVYYDGNGDLVEKLLNSFRAEGLTESERTFLTFALDLAADRMASRGDEFTAEDEAALTSLRAMASPAAVPVPDETAGDETGELERLRAELDETAAALHSNRERRIKAEVERDELKLSRAEVLGEAANAVAPEAFGYGGTDHYDAWTDAAAKLRQMAAEAGAS